MMIRFVKRASKKLGLPPGTIVHVGDKKTEYVRIRVIDYDEDSFEEKELSTVDECLPYKDKPTVTWINIDGLHEVDIIQKIGKEFGLHPLVLEDIVNTEQRPKIEDLEDYIFVISKMLSHNEEENQIEIEQFSLVLGKKFVLSFQEKFGDIFNPVRQRLRVKRGSIRKRGADYLMYALIDAIVDNYFSVLEKIGEKVESLEEELLTDPSPETG